MFEAVLIANRGEIAIRVARGCRELGIRTVAVYSEADRDALHVRLADEAYLLGPAAAAESYLSIERILDVAARAEVQAIHPGYGFLAENADFATAVADAGMTFIGPPPQAIARMGDKLSAREVALAAQVPVVPGTLEPTDDVEVARAFGEEHGYPIAVKAMFGGGGRGMKVVRDAEELQDALDAARREAQAAFGRGECYLERYLERPRHVEIQVLADHHGNAIHLGERDCSLQRRHQKLVEEAPAPNLPAHVREAMGSAAVQVAEEMGYTNAGTCEFLLDPTSDPDDPSFYFLEMNTRLQVEHPVTELVTGVDLVHQQLRIAAGEPLAFGQDEVELRGHAIEVRINAEDPGAGFVPTPGPVDRLVPPLGPWVRLDTGVESGSVISRDYDSMIGKLIVWGEDRDVARARMSRALDELVLDGVPTTVPFHVLAMTHPDFAAGTHATVSVEREWDLGALTPATPAGTDDAGDEAATELTVEVDGRRLAVKVFGALGAAGSSAPSSAPRRTRSGNGTRQASVATEDLLAPMQGTVIAYAVEDGATVSTGDRIVVLEAMKMENAITAHRDGVVRAVGFAAGDVVEQGAVLARIEDA